MRHVSPHMAGTKGAVGTEPPTALSLYLRNPARCRKDISRHTRVYAIRFGSGTPAAIACPCRIAAGF